MIDMGNKNLSLRIKKGLLDEVDSLVESMALNRSDFFGAAVDMLTENPKMAETALDVNRVDENLLGKALEDNLQFYAVRKLLGNNGLAEAKVIINKGNLRMDISKSTLVRFKPPNTIEFEPTGDFRIQVDLVPGIAIKLSAAGKEYSLSEEMLRYLGTRYELLIEIP
jgi:Arc/MetJ-type ribon-helix-helix transcriptional regulator